MSQTQTLGCQSGELWITVHPEFDTKRRQGCLLYIVALVGWFSAKKDKIMVYLLTDLTTTKLWSIHFLGHLVTENRHLISDLKLTHYCWNWLTNVEIDYTVEIDSTLLKLTLYCWNWLYTVEIDSILLKLTLYCWSWLSTVEIDSILLKLTLYCWNWLYAVEIDSTFEIDSTVEMD